MQNTTFFAILGVILYTVRKFKKPEEMEQFWGRIRIQHKKNLWKFIVWSQGLEFRQILSACVIFKEWYIL